MTFLTMPTTVPAAARRPSTLRRMLAGGAAFDAVGGVFCLVAASQLARWLSIPRGAAYGTGAAFLVATAAGGLALCRHPLTVTWIVGANEVFAAWCLLVVVAADPSPLGVALFVMALLTSAGTGAVQIAIARRVPGRT
jgi:hypothetical protein